MSKFRGVIFDMDGTLVEPLLDFSAIRAELNIPPGEGIIEAIERMSPRARRQSMEYLYEQEMEVAGRARLLPHAEDVLDAVKLAGLKSALLTRNMRGAMEMVLERFELSFDMAMCREDGPIKPEPAGILRACKTLAIEPRETACVGDFRYDITAANAAGAVSILLDRNGGLEFAHEADYVIGNLAELKGILEI